MSNKLLLLNLPGFEHAVSSVSINLGIASIAAEVRQSGFPVKILDLNLYEDYNETLISVINDYNPDFIGFGLCTPQLYLAKNIVNLIKTISKDICVICGGPHPSALPEETLNQTGIDIVCIGESDYIVSEIIKNFNNNLKNLPGICYREKNEFYKTNRSDFIDIEKLPFPALDLFEINKYNYPSQSCKKNPVTLIETSRGCPGNCIFCSRIIVGSQCRFKTAERVVEEFEYVNKLGFSEVHFSDDNFITDKDRAIKICDLLIERNLKIPWVPRSGIRVDYIDEFLLIKMKKSGCYHLPYGIETLVQDILDDCNKGIKVNQIENAIKISKELGFEVTGYFMIGLPRQKIDDIKRDIEFAEKLKLDFVKFGVTIPYPGTKLFNTLKFKNKILTYEWQKYHYASSPFVINEQDEIDINEFMKIDIGSQKLINVLNLVLDNNLNPIK